MAAQRKCPLLLLLNLLLQALVAASSSLTKPLQPHLQLQPVDLRDLVEEKEEKLTATVALHEDEMGEDEGWMWRLVARSLHPSVASVESDWVDPEVDAQRWSGGAITPAFNLSSLERDETTRLYSLNSTFTVKGRLLGKTGVQIRLVRADDWLRMGQEEDWFMQERQFQIGNMKEQVAEVWVKRSPDSVRLTKYFIFSLMVLIPLANILMGCELDLGVVLTTIRRPVAPMIGMCTQFLLMPLLAYGIARALFIPSGEYSLALGLFVTGCAPGGGASNFWTILLDGNVNLSVTMTFISTIASFVMMPLWISLLGKEFLNGFGPGAALKVPYAKIASSLAMLIVPLLIGVLIAKKKPSWAVKARKVMRPFIIFVLLFVIIFGTLSNLYMFRMLTVRSVFGGLLLPWLGFTVGCFAAIMTRRVPADVTAIAVETGIQNTGIAILLLKFSFPAPDADISALLPVIVAAFTPGPLLLGAAVHSTIKWIKRRRAETGDVEKCAGSAPTTPSFALTPAPRPLVSLELPLNDSSTTKLVPSSEDLA